MPDVPGDVVHIDRAPAEVVPTPGLAIVGLGTAGAVMLAAALAYDRVRVVAVADARIDDLPLDDLPPSVRRYRNIETMLEDDEVTVVHIATPTSLHLKHAVTTLGAGRHVIVEKPIASDLDAARMLVDAASASPCHLIVGHSSSYDPHVQAAAALARDPRFGGIVSILSTKSTDWLRRPRLPEELDSNNGGGLIRRQGVHQIDVVRTIMGGGSLAVREVQVRRDRGRETIGSYLAWLTGDEGQAVVVSHDGVGGTIDASFTPPTTDLSDAEAGEVAAKRRRTDDQLSRLLSGQIRRSGEYDRGEIVVLGSGGDIVATAHEVYVSDQLGTRTIDLGALPEGRAAVLDELVATIGGAPAFHDAAWGYENVRICEAIEASATDHAAPATRR